MRLFSLVLHVSFKCTCWHPEWEKAEKASDEVERRSVTDAGRGLIRYKGRSHCACRGRWKQTLLDTGQVKRERLGQLAESEIMTILIHFHPSQYRDFKAFSTQPVLPYLRADFPGLVSYNRFVQLMPSVLFPRAAYLETCRGQCNGLSFVDSIKRIVCHNRRIKQHRVFAGLAERGKDSVDWYYGFKLHLIVTDEGDLLACRLTPGTVDDRHPVPQMAQGLFGKLVGDKGYLSKDLVAPLLHQGGALLTPICKNRKPRLVRLTDKLLLRKRVLIEPINDQLKHVSQIDHSRQRSPANFLVNVLAGLLAYCHQTKKPSLQVTPEILALWGH